MMPAATSNNKVEEFVWEFCEFFKKYQIQTKAVSVCGINYCN